MSIKMVLNTKAMNIDYRGYIITRQPSGECEIYCASGEHIINEDNVESAKRLIDYVKEEQYLPLQNTDMRL